MTDAQLNRALRGAAIEAVTHFCRLNGLKVEDPNLIKSSDAEQMLGCTRPTLGRLAEKGEIRRVQVGAQWKYDRESIIAYLDKNERSREQM